MLLLCNKYFFYNLTCKPDLVQHCTKAFVCQTKLVFSLDLILCTDSLGFFMFLI